MEYNNTLYKDLTPAKQLDKKVLNKMVWRSLFLQASFNYKECKLLDGYMEYYLD